MVTKQNPPPIDEPVALKEGAIITIVLFLVTIGLAVSVHNFFHLPPMLGMMTGLGLLQVYGYFLKQKMIRLTEQKLAKLIDRSAAKKLEKEILLSQINDSEASYSGPKVSDYAISGSISDASFNKKYYSSSLRSDGQGSFYRIPPRFKYEAAK